MYRLKPRHLIVVGTLFLAAAFTLGHLLPGSSLYHYWIWFGAMTLAILTAVFSGVSGSGSASLWEAFRRCILQPIAIYSVFLAGSLLLPDAHVIQYGLYVEYENYDVSIVFLLGIVILIGISLSISIGEHFLRRYLRPRL